MDKEYIEREAALNAQNKSMNLAECRKRLERLPAADVVPVRHGRWIKYSPQNSDMLTCSECEKYWILDGDQYDFRFCPNCSALMDKDGDGE